MSFNLSMAFAETLGEGARQIDQYTARQNELEDKRLSEDAAMRKEQALLVRQKALVHFGYEQRNSYSNALWDPSQKRMVTKEEVSSMSPDQRAQLVSLDEHQLQQTTKLEKAKSGIRQATTRKGIMEQAQLLGIPVDEYLKKKAKDAFYGKGDNLTKSQKVNLIEKIRPAYEDAMLKFDTGAREGRLGTQWGAKKATKTKPTLKEWTKQARPEEYGLIWGGAGILSGKKTSTTKGGKSSDVGNLISSLLTGKKTDNQLLPSHAVKGFGGNGFTGDLPAAEATKPNNQDNAVSSVGSFLGGNVNGAELLGAVADKSINGLVKVIQNSPKWMKRVLAYSLKTNIATDKAIWDFAKWAYSTGDNNKPVMQRF